MPTDMTFYGSSDDLFMVMVNGKDEEECYPPQQYLVDASDGRLVVSARYGEREDVWSIGVEPYDDDVAIPNWPVHFTLMENGYSAGLIIEVPDDATYEIINKDSED